MTVRTSGPTLARFLADIPDEGLKPLRDSLSQRGTALADNGDDGESRAWVSLYGFLVTEIETALLRQRTGITL